MTPVPLLSADRIERLPERAREVVEYRKSGLSLNHIQGCSLGCAYCIRHTYGLWDENKPVALVSDAEAVDELVAHRYFQPHVTPIQLFLWQLNEEVEIPDLSVILEADPDVIAERLTERGPHNRFQLTPDSSHAETRYYRDAGEQLTRAGFNVLTVDCTRRPAEHSAALILDQLTDLLAQSRESVR